MKPEPLTKDKRDSFLDGLHPYYERDCVKSAVEGLKDELLMSKRKFNKASKREMLSEYDEGYIDGSLDSLDGCLKLIDKWFQDVIE